MIVTHIGACELPDGPPGEVRGYWESASCSEYKPYSPGACQRCWDDAWIESRIRGGTQVENYRRLLRDRDQLPRDKDGITCRTR